MADFGQSTVGQSIFGQFVLCVCVVFVCCVCVLCVLCVFCTFLFSWVLWCCGVVVLWVCPRFGCSPRPLLTRTPPPPDRPKFRALFFPSPATIFILSSLSLEVLSLNFGGVFEVRGLAMCTCGVLGLLCEAPARTW